MYFICEPSDQQACDHTRHQKCRCIIQKAGIFHNDHGYKQLSHIVGDASCYADDWNGNFFISVMTIRLRAAPARL